MTRFPFNQWTITDHQPTTTTWVGRKGVIEFDGEGPTIVVPRNSRNPVMWGPGDHGYRLPRNWGFVPC